MDERMKLSRIPAALKNNTTNFFEFFDQQVHLKKQYSEIYIDLMKMSAFLGKQNFKKGDRIGLIGVNSYNYLLAELGVIIGGYVSVPFTERDFNDQIDSLQEIYDLKLLFMDMKYMNSDTDGNVHSFESIPEKIASEDDTEADFPSLDNEDVFTVIFTSGTTGSPKGIEMRVKSVQEWICTIMERFDFQHDDKVVDFFPLSISNARLFIYASFLIGFDLVLTIPEQLMKVLILTKPTILQGVPYFFETIYATVMNTINGSLIKKLVYNSYRIAKKLLHQKAVDKIQNKIFKSAKDFWGGRMRLLVSGSAAISQATLKFYDDIGLKIYEAYGINEVGLVSINSPQFCKIGSVGKPFLTKMIKFGENKEILIKSDYNWGRSYILDEQGQGKKIFREDGYVATGDMGYMDKDGFLFIEGRIKEVLVLNNGDKIHPEQIEMELKKTQLIKQVVAIGHQKPFITCVVVQNDNIDRLRIDSAISIANKNLADAFKIKDYIIAKEPFSVVNGMMNSTLKVNRDNVYNIYKKDVNKLYG